MKSGFAAIVGRPSTGKSTLLNALCGGKVAITSAVPQTTRNAIRGIVNREAGQVVFLDTPGYHASERKLNIYLKDIVHRALDDADVVLYIGDAGRTFGREEQIIMDLLKNSALPVIAAVNKIDIADGRLSEIRGAILANLRPVALFDVSALTGVNLDELADAVVNACPEGDPLYPGEFYTDQSPAFRISEIIREQAVMRSEQEIPHSLYVEIADMEFRDRSGKVSEGTDGRSEDPTGGRKNLWVRAFLTVERESQVGILVGRGGAKIKQIRIAALMEMRRVFPWKIHLDLRVKVNPKWRRQDALLRRMLGPDR